MLKPYVCSDNPSDVSDSKPVLVLDTVVSETGSADEDDGLMPHSLSVLSARLQNSELLPQLDSVLQHLSKDASDDLKAFIWSYPTLFTDVPRQTHLLEHDIEVGNSSPVKQNYYRVNPVKRALMQSEVDYLVKHELAVPSSSPWSSPCILVPKPDGTFRFCTDYRKVNAVTVPDSFPLPRIEDCVDCVGNAKYVTKLDLLKGYWQVPLTERASLISAFVTPDSFMQYSVMAFGMRKAPATFQRLSCVLQGLPNCTAYLDDVVVHSSTWDEHMEMLKAVFERLDQALLTLNLAKCDFGKATVLYLGREVGQGRVRTPTDKVKAILDYPVPCTRCELRRFLGMAGYYRAFCKNFSVIVLPLTDLLHANVEYRWSDDCQKAFEGLKSVLCSAPVLAAPNFSYPFKLDVDAYDSVAGGAVPWFDCCGRIHFPREG
ncbi:hypothetical protein SRHO_G00057240 [Serrasalmus rhombeus]